MTIVAFDRTNVGTIRAELAAAHAAICAKYGITLDIGRISFDGASFRGKLTGKLLVTTKTSDNVEVTIDASLVRMLRAHNLQVDGMNGRKLVGYKAANHKYPFIYAQNGRRYKCSALQASFYFAKKETV